MYIDKKKIEHALKHKHILEVFQDEVLMRYKLLKGKLVFEVQPGDWWLSHGTLDQLTNQIEDERYLFKIKEA